MHLRKKREERCADTDCCSVEEETEEAEPYKVLTSPPMSRRVVQLYTLTPSEGRLTVSSSVPSSASSSSSSSSSSSAVAKSEQSEPTEPQRRQRKSREPRAEQKDSLMQGLSR